MNSAGSPQAVPLPQPPGRELNELERELAGLWAEVLGVRLSTIGAKTDFVAAGGDEERLAELACGVLDVFGAQPDIVQLAAAPTLEDMAGVVKAASRFVFGRDAAPEQVAAGADGRLPVYALGAMGATIIGWRRVAKLLDRRIPMYASESTAFDASGRPIPRMEEVAARHIERLRAAVGDQPVVLAGHSFGGLVAYEMACQLEAAGAPLAGLVLLDTPSRRGLQREPWSRARARPLMRRTIKREVKAARARWVVRGHAAHVLHVRDEATRVRWILAAQRVAHRQFQAKPYGGRLTLLTCDGLGRSRDESLEWRLHVRGGIDLHEVDGEHRTLLTARWAASTAAVLDECLLPLTVPGAQPAARRG